MVSRQRTSSPAVWQKLWLGKVAGGIWSPLTAMTHPPPRASRNVPSSWWVLTNTLQRLAPTSRSKTVLPLKHSWAPGIYWWATFSISDRPSRQPGQDPALPAEGWSSWDSSAGVRTGAWTLCCVHSSQWLIFCSVSWCHATFQVYLQVSSHTLITGSFGALKGSGQGLNESFHWFSLTWCWTPMSLWSIPLSRQIGWVTTILLVLLVVEGPQWRDSQAELCFWFGLNLNFFFQTSCTFFPIILN